MPSHVSVAFLWPFLSDCRQILSDFRKQSVRERRYLKIEEKNQPDFPERMRFEIAAI